MRCLELDNDETEKARADLDQELAKEDQSLASDGPDSGAVAAASSTREARPPPIEHIARNQKGLLHRPVPKNINIMDVYFFDAWQTEIKGTRRLGFRRQPGVDFHFRTLAEAKDPRWEEVVWIQTYSEKKLIRTVKVVDKAPQLEFSSYHARVGSVCFICDLSIHVMANEEPGVWVKWRFGEFHVPTWDMSTDLQMLTNSPAKFPNRIGFVLDDDGILPLQQCVTMKDEVSHRIPHDRWVRDPSALLQAEYGIVSALIEREYVQADAAAQVKIRALLGCESNCPWVFRLDNPIRWHLNLVMRTGRVGVLFRVPEKNPRDW